MKVMFDEVPFGFFVVFIVFFFLTFVQWKFAKYAEENAKWKYFEIFIFASYDDINIIKSLYLNIIIVKKDILCLYLLTQNHILK